MSDVALSSDNVSAALRRIRRSHNSSFSAALSCLSPIWFDRLAVVRMARRNDDDQRRERKPAENEKPVIAQIADYRTCGPAIALFTNPATIVRMAPPAPPPAI
jgi:hypothetical protein